DGMLAGPNVSALAEMAAAVPLPIIASGGVTTVDDVRRLAGLGLAGCIVGRALYEGRLRLSEILQILGNQESGARGQGSEVRSQRSEVTNQSVRLTSDL